MSAWSSSVFASFDAGRVTLRGFQDLEESLIGMWDSLLAQCCILLRVFSLWVFRKLDNRMRRRTL